MQPMFTPEQRDTLRSELLERAATDRRIASAAITGSAAAGREDAWSDIDLAFGLADAAELPNVLEDWTAHMYGRHFAVHHVDLRFGAWTYRTFLLPGALQVDLAFVSAAEFRALASTFRLVFGEVREPWHPPPPEPDSLIGMGWLYALHARSSIARNRPWQAQHMISGVRDNALALACVRHGLPASHGRGLDQLPSGVAAQFEACLVRHLDAVELTRAFRASLSGLLSEVERVDVELARRLTRTLADLWSGATRAETR